MKPILGDDAITGLVEDPAASVDRNDVTATQDFFVDFTQGRARGPDRVDVHSGPQPLSHDGRLRGRDGGQDDFGPADSSFRVVDADDLHSEVVAKVRRKGIAVDRCRAEYSGGF